MNSEDQDKFHLDPDGPGSTFELPFAFSGMPVGLLEAAAPPRGPGIYRYVAFRGPGHLEMQLQRGAGRNPRCYYNVGNVRVLFTVLDCPKPGLLELGDFATALLSEPPPMVDEFVTPDPPDPPDPGGP